MTPDAMTVVFLAVMAFIISYMVVAALRSRQEPVKLKRTVTVLRCGSCGHEWSRDFREGDFVGREEGECPKCGGRLVVNAIYVEEISERT